MSCFSHLRVMDVDDLDWVESVERRCYPMPWSRRGLELALRNGLGFIFCAADETPLGYCFVQTAADEVELLNFAVAPQQQGRGVGSAALRALLGRFEGGRFAQMFLEVRASNTPAIRLYQRAGFNEIGLRPGYYRNPDGSREDAVLMAHTFLPDFPA
ncbi:ribosomal protein S18-alanine N-acetyltransferase [Sulfurivirga sp.]|uniref:ribosomal protein S18-alanine N-acetyltransferase n=1 Tax=Sulfurivirga sp. TaxID=2614236 RepID=UPI0025D35B14|nr:ribosomal protein S18-alanine N-acetyltransferase [Sulfurivirga sp.]